MQDVSPVLFLNFFLFLLIPFLSGYIFKKFKLSPIIGYIVGGVLLGNFFPGLISSQIISNFAYFGIIFLLFTVGLEINFDKLIVLKKFIVAGGLLQIVVSIVFVTLISLLFQFNFIQSLLIGIALSSSSTALVAKIIQDRGEESSFVGELALGILMFQDLAFIPFIIVFTALQSGSAAPLEVMKNVAIGVGESTVILCIMYYLGRKIVPFIFDKVARTSRELLNLFIVIFIFVIGYASSLVGVPIFISMFIAGVLVSQTSEHYHIFSQIRPLRDLLAIIFFVYIGSHILFSEIITEIPQILLFTAAIMAIKSIILLGIFLYFRFNSRVALSLALFLFQVSENAFILLSLAFSHNIFNSHQYLLVMSSVLLTLILTPVLINRKEVIYSALRSFFKKYIPSVEVFIKHRIDFEPAALNQIDIKNHIVICGYGRVGSSIGRALTLANIPFVAIDYNFHTVQKAKKEGVQIIYGDPTDIDILDYAQVDTAAAIIMVVPERYAQEAIILNAKKLNQNIIIISRVHSEEHQKSIKDLGAHVVVQPELEASLSIIKKIFFIKKVPQDEMIRKIHHFKLEQGIAS